MTVRKLALASPTRAAALRDFEARLAEAPDVRAVGAIVVDELLRSVGVTSVNFFPLPAGRVADGSDAVAIHDEFSPEQMFARFFASAPDMVSEFGSLDALFSPDKRTVNLNERFGAQLQQTRTFNDFWRPAHIERQIVALMKMGSEPLGYFCAARRQANRPFTEAERQHIEALRVRVEQVLIDHRRRQEWQSSLALLGALSTSLPLDAALLDESGALLWISDALARRNGLVTTRLGTTLLLTSQFGSVLDELRAATLEAARTQATQASAGAYDLRWVGQMAGRRLFLAVASGHAPHIFLGPGEAVPPPRPFELAAVEDDALRLAARRWDFSHRQQELLALLCAGKCNKEVAASLAISPKTVEVHLQSMYRKAGVRSRLELVAAVRSLAHAQ